MKRRSLLVVGVVLACARPPAATDPGAAASATDAPDSTAAAPKRAPHHYRGAIAVPGQGELEYFVVLTPAEDGPGWNGTIDIPQQGAKGLALTDVAWSETSVAFTMPVGVAASWKVTRDDAEDFECAFEQGPVSLPCSIEEIDEAAFASARTPKRPQTPQPPFPYEARDVKVQSGDIELAGTLTIPGGDGPHPAVVLITGSGAQDRDETIMGHKPFWVWADHLSRNGIAVLRTDDRGVGGSGGSVVESTAEDFAGDALAAVALLADQPEIDKKRIGLMGHSEGGLVAPLATAKSKKVAFIVLLAAPGVPGKEIITRQAADIARAAGAGDDDVAAAQEQRDKMWKMIEASKDPEKLREDLEAFLIEDTKRLAGDSGVSDAEIEQAAKIHAEASSTRWFRDFLVRDPAKPLRKVKIPVLAITGSKDLQVHAETNLNAIDKALRRAGNKDVTTQELPDLNHLFQKAQTGLVGEYESIEETINRAALDLVTGWIREHTGLEGG